jgi:hypothetical protein
LGSEGTLVVGSNTSGVSNCGSDGDNDGSNLFGVGAVECLISVGGSVSSVDIRFAVNGALDPKFADCRKEGVALGLTVA